MLHTQFGNRAWLSFIFDIVETQIAMYLDLIYMHGINLFCIHRMRINSLQFSLASRVNNIRYLSFFVCILFRVY
jgi:hypothetical protein